jgi:hypothetical protein
MDKMSSKMAAFFAKKGEKGLAKHEKREAMGKEKDTKAIAMKEKRAMKGAPKNLKQYEAKEHKGMGFAKGGKVKRYAEGGMEGMAPPPSNTAQQGAGMQALQARVQAPPPSNTAQQGAGMQALQARVQAPPPSKALQARVQAPPPSNTAQQDARMQARTAALQGRGVGQKQVDAMQQRMQGRFNDRNAARGMERQVGITSMGEPTQSQMQSRYGAAPQQAPASPGGFAKGGRVKANGIARKGKTRGRII